MAADKSDKPVLAKVQVNKTEVPEERTVEETLQVEARVAEDQIADYHQKNPTLKATGPQYDPEVLGTLATSALKAAQPSKSEVKEQAAEIKEKDGI